MKTFKGAAAAPGLASGQVLLINTEAAVVVRRVVADAEAECVRLEEARKAVGAQIAEAVGHAEAGGMCKDDVRILKAHLMIIGDDEFYGEASAMIRAQAVCAEWALQSVTATTTARFAAMRSAYLAERAHDIEQTSEMVIRRLTGCEQVIGPCTGKGKIVLVARDLAPSDTMKFDPASLAGLVTATGGVTSHTVILAKSLGIPAVTNVAGLCSGGLASGDACLVDGLAGTFVTAPDAAAEAAFAERSAAWQARRVREAAFAEAPCRTRDGVAVPAEGNLAEPCGCQGILDNGAEGIGLFRSEFLFMNRNDYPGEEEQYTAYRAVAEKLHGMPLIVRTMDIGGDKQVTYMDLPKEDNPFLGWRAVRISLERKEVFRTQLRAILRAGVAGDVWTMVPMIVSVEELRAVKAEWQAAQDSLEADGIAFKRDMRLGIMVETPAAAMLAEDLAAECDFFSIGTNDLIQYVTACDRLNPRLQRLYTGCNPAVLRLMARVVAAGRARGIPVGVCGEMAADLRMMPLLVGMGVSSLSMSAGSIPAVKYATSRLDSVDARALLADVLRLSTETDVGARLDRFQETLGPDAAPRRGAAAPNPARALPCTRKGPVAP